MCVVCDVLQRRCQGVYMVRQWLQSSQAVVVAVWSQELLL